MDAILFDRCERVVRRVARRQAFRLAHIRCMELEDLEQAAWVALLEADLDTLMPESHIYTIAKRGAVDGLRAVEWPTRYYKKQIAEGVLLPCQWTPLADVQHRLCA